jgi:hypothetical protein
MTPGPADCFPGLIDGNIPVFWLEEGSRRRLVAFTFEDGDCCDNDCYRQVRISGGSLAEAEAAAPRPVELPAPVGAWRGIQAVHLGPKTDPAHTHRTLYGWYHDEMAGTCAPSARKELTAPRMGAIKSLDAGYTWEDLGIVLEAPPATNVTDTANLFFCGGYGDFSVVPDHDGRHFYFFFGSYRRMRDTPDGPPQQGLAVARMAAAHLEEPVGHVEIWNGESWQPHDPTARAHHAIAPIFPALGDWHTACAEASCDWSPCDLDKAEELGLSRCPAEGLCTDALWGPTVHWNETLGKWVMLMNRACTPCWGVRGHWVSFNDDLSNPAGWCAPIKVDDLNSLYAQVIGYGVGETDRRIAGPARYITGFQTCGTIEFRRAPHAP